MNTLARATYYATIVTWIALCLPVVWALMTGDYPGASWFYGLQEDDEFVSLVFDIRNSVRVGTW
jgi:hypothetical protein